MEGGRKEVTNHRDGCVQAPQLSCLDHKSWQGSNIPSESNSEVLKTWYATHPPHIPSDSIFMQLNLSFKLPWFRCRNFITTFSKKKKKVVWSADDLRFIELLPADTALTASNEPNRSITFYQGIETHPHSRTCNFENKAMEGIKYTTHIL